MNRLNLRMKPPERVIRSSKRVAKSFYQLEARNVQRITTRRSRPTAGSASLS